LGKRLEEEGAGLFGLFLTGRTVHSGGFINATSVAVVEVGKSLVMPIVLVRGLYEEPAT